MSMFTTGVAKRSGARPDPPLHLVVSGPYGPVLWCSAGPAISGFVTATGRRCHRCLALARADVAEMCEPGEASELDWFMRRDPKAEAAPNRENTP